MSTFLFTIFQLLAVLVLATTNNIDETFKLKVLNYQNNRLVLGRDDRVLYNSPSMPYTAVGQVRYGRYKNWACTGYLVGVRHVLTNSHCVDPLYPIYFRPSYNNGKYYNKPALEITAKLVFNGTLTLNTSLSTIVLPKGFSVANDWAIIILNNALDSSFGFFKVASGISTSWYNTPMFSLAAYANLGAKNSNGNYPVIQIGCRLIKYDPIFRYNYHDCDTNGGSSGASLFAYMNGAYTIVALNNGEVGLTNCNIYVERKCANIAVNTSKFLPTLQMALVAYK